MSRVEVSISFTMHVESPELRLLLKALTHYSENGPAEEKGERMEALMLHAALSRQRAGQVKSALEANEKLIRNIEKHGCTTTP